MNGINLGREFSSSTSYKSFRNTSLKLIGPAKRETFDISDSVGIKS